MTIGEARDVATELRSWAAALLAGDTSARCQVVQTDAESMLAVAKHLDAFCDKAMQRLVAPPPPSAAATYPRQCWFCRSWERTARDEGKCHRFPQTVAKGGGDFCEEFTPREVTP